MQEVDLNFFDRLIDQELDIGAYKPKETKPPVQDSFLIQDMQPLKATDYESIRARELFSNNVKATSNKGIEELDNKLRNLEKSFYPLLKTYRSGTIKPKQEIKNKLISDYAKIKEIKEILGN